MQAILVIGTVLCDPITLDFQTKVDHKNVDDNRMFRMRYIVDDQYFKDMDGDEATKPKPIFFYAGSQGDIWDFYGKSGFVTTALAKQYGALVIYGEHRFFGASFPIDKKYGPFEKGNNTLMTEDQTMADYVDLIRYIKTKYNAEDKAVIAFGGLYSGMLAAWSRMEYPHVFQGALSSSAPLLYFANSTSAPEWRFAEIIS